MALELQYKFTFIDVDEQDPAEAQHARSRSCPPTAGRHSAMDTGMDAHEEEKAMRGYVLMLKQKQGDAGFAKALHQKADSPFGSVLDASPASTAAPESEGDWSPGQSTNTDDSPATFMEGTPRSSSLDRRVAELLPSHGSLGHPEVCRRPCIYFLAGHCENGNACGLPRGGLRGARHAGGRVGQHAGPAGIHLGPGHPKPAQDPGAHELLQPDWIGDAPVPEPTRKRFRELRATHGSPGE
ncbi:MTPC1, partial [Symbiodinium necroappetens]